MSLVDAELSEPYSIFTYRYFLRNWPSLCVLAFDSTKKTGTGETPPAPPTVRGGGCRHAVATPKGACFGVVVGKMDDHRGTGGEREARGGGARALDPPRAGPPAAPFPPFPPSILHRHDAGVHRHARRVGRVPRTGRG